MQTTQTKHTVSHHKRRLIQGVAALTAGSTAWLTASPVIAAGTEPLRAPKPLGHTRTLTTAEMAHISGARQQGTIGGGSEAPSTGGGGTAPGGGGTSPGGGGTSPGGGGIAPGSGGGGSEEVGAGGASGSGGGWQPTSGSGASTATGNKLTQHPIVGWVQRGGLPIGFTLTHNSIATTNNSVGKNWTHSFNVYLVVAAGGGGGGQQLSATSHGQGLFRDAHVSTPGAIRAAQAQVTGAAGDTVQVVLGDGKGVTFTENVDGTYSAPAGVYDKLVKNTNGSYTLTRKNLTVWQFGANKLLISVADKNGNTATIGYTNDFVTSVTDATGRVLNLTWDTTNKRVTSTTDPAGRTWNLAYDAAGNLLSVTDPAAVSGGTRFVTTYAYDSANRITQITDRRGKAWTYGYNTAGKLAWEKTPLLHQTSYTYSGSTTTVTDPRGNSVVYTYNANGELASVKDEANFVESYTYNANHDKTGVTNKRGKVWTFTYDARGNVLTAKNPLNQTANVTYNAKDEPLTETTPLGYATTYTYDANGNLLTQANALGQTTTYTIGTYGLVSQKKDARNKSTSYSYNTSGDLASTTTPGGKTTTFSYNTLGVPTGTTDALGRTATFVLDGLYRKIGAGYTSPVAANMSESFTYDANNNLTQFVDSTGTTSRTYDDAGRFISETKGANTVTYTYDGTTAATKGRLVALTDAAGRTVSHTYTSRGQLVTVGDGTGTASYTYGAGGEELTTTNANGTTVAKSYDDAGRLSSLVNKKSDGTVLSSFAYTYRADGKKSGVTEINGSVVAYTYDNAGRLTGESRTGAAAYSVTYTLDADGNRTGQTVGTKVSAFTYDADDALTSVGSNTGGLNNSYTYNANGDQASRIIAGSVFTLAYNAKGELSGITGGGSSSKSFAYDAQERRVTRSVGGVATTFIRAGDANGGVVLNEKQGTATTASCTYGNGLLAKGSESYLFDGQGNTRQVTNTSGAVTSSSTSDAFGVAVASTGTKPEYGYGAQSGYRDDGDAGLIHIGARYYDPQVGQFTTRDTYLSQKPYAYCEHDPVNFTDPSGHISKDLISWGTAVVGTIGSILTVWGGGTTGTTTVVTTATTNTSILWGAFTTSTTTTTTTTTVGGAAAGAGVVAGGIVLLAAAGIVAGWVLGNEIADEYYGSPDTW